MTKKLHLIYIPGLGDAKVGGQRAAVRAWHWYGVEAELFQMNWADQEPWESKFQRLLARIDELGGPDRAIALVGASAGATAVLNAFAARQGMVIGAVCIAGKIHRPENIRDKYRREDPAFITAANDCPQSLAKLDGQARSRLQSRYALFDETVNTSDSIIPGAHNKRIFSIGHVPTIASQLTFGAPGFISFLKRQQKQFGTI